MSAQTPTEKPKPTPITDLIRQLNGLAMAAWVRNDEAAVATLTEAAERLAALSGTDLTAGDWFWCSDNEYGADSIRGALEELTENEPPGVYIEQICRSISLKSVWVALRFIADETPEIHVFATQGEAQAKADDLSGGRQEGLGL